MPASLTDMSARGITIVNSADALMSQVDTTTTAVLIDEAAFESVDSRWLNDQYTRGVVIGGIDLNLNRLLDVLPAPGENAARWFNYPSDRKFYSLLVKGHGCAGARQDFMDRGLNGFELMMETIKSFSTCGTSL
jgi:hypothetical protein